MRAAGPDEMEDATLKSFPKEAYPKAWDYHNMTHLRLIAPLVPLNRWHYRSMRYCIVQSIDPDTIHRHISEPMRRGRFCCRSRPRHPTQVKDGLELTFASTQHVRPRRRSNARTTPCGHMKATFKGGRYNKFNNIPAMHPSRIKLVGA